MAGSEDESESNSGGQGQGGGHAIQQPGGGDAGTMQLSAATVPHYRPHVRPPGPVGIRSSQRKENWLIHKQLWENYSIITGVDNAELRIRKAEFMNTLGPDTLRICNGLDIGTSDSVESIIQKLDDYCIGTTNEIMKHFRFNMRDQRSDESFTEWLADLRAIAKTCSFNSIQKVEDTLLRNRIIHGIRDKKAQAKMLDRRGADLETVIDIARTCEATEHHLKTISQTSDVHAVNSDKSYKKNKRFTKRKPTTQSDNVKKCLFCMKEHVMRKESCPAWGKTCNTCKKTGHFKGSKMCKSGGKKHVHALYDESESDSSDTEELCGVESINNVQNTGKAVYCTMLVGEKCNESEVKFQIDCGATVNVLRLKHLTVSEKDKISNSQIILKMWNGSTINAVGKLAVRVRNPKSGGKYRAPFVIVDSDLTPLLSRKTAEQMGLPIPQISINSPYSKSGKSYGWEY